MQCAALLVFLLAQDAPPEPGPIAVKQLRLKTLRIQAVQGDAHNALKTFLDAHRAHKDGDTDKALGGYLAFLGIAARAQLPARYDTTAKERLDAMVANVHMRYEKALTLYAKDRTRGVAELTDLAKRYPMLPEGECALALWHSDRLHAAVVAARADKDAKVLEKAVRTYVAALYRYEAKNLLIELGGPDLFEPGERVGDKPTETPDEDEDEEDDDDDGGTVIESSDD